jgi:hypothetical protein
MMLKESYPLLPSLIVRYIYTFLNDLYTACFFGIINTSLTQIFEIVLLCGLNYEESVILAQLLPVFCHIANKNLLPK